MHYIELSNLWVGKAQGVHGGGESKFNFNLFLPCAITYIKHNVICKGRPGRKARYMYIQ